MTYKATAFDVESTRVKGGHVYNEARGFGFSNSPKEAIAKALQMREENSKGYENSVDGGLTLYKNGVEIFHDEYA